MPRIYDSASNPIDFCQRCFPSETQALTDYTGNRIQRRNNSPLYWSEGNGFTKGGSWTSDLVEASVYDNDQRDRVGFMRHVGVPEGEGIWEGVRGDGPDQRGNCSGYDAEHPDYFDMGYRCHDCQTPLGNGHGDRPNADEQRHHDAWSYRR